MALDIVNRRDVSKLVAEALAREDHADGDAPLQMADVDRVLLKVLEVIGESIAGGSNVSLRGFGTFEPRVMSPVVRQRPDTLERVRQPEHVRVIFRPSRSLKADLNAALHARLETAS